MNNAESEVGKSALVLCAGLGTRMQPLTLTMPKPLVKVAGKPLIAHAVDQLENNGVTNIVLNAHYFADQIKAWVDQQNNPALKLSDETGLLLETGGGVLKAKSMLGPAPFFVLNSDAFWVDRPGASTLKKMRRNFDRQKCDFLLLLAKHEAAIGFDGKGDFFLASDGRLKRRGQEKFAPYIFAGCYLVHPRVLVNCPDGAFSMNVLWDRALASRRIWGMVHNGLWLHVGTPQAIGEAERAIEIFQSKL